MEEKISACKAPTLVEMLTVNRKLIDECLMISDELYKLITTDSYKTNTEEQPECILQDAMLQGDKLNTLLGILKNIKTNIKD